MTSPPRLALLSALSLSLAAGCNARQGSEPSPLAAGNTSTPKPTTVALVPLPPQASGQASPAPSASPSPQAGALAGAPAAASAGARRPAGPPRSGPLSTLFAALHELEAKRRSAPVRALWLGDSHGQSDLWSGIVRTAFQKRFGDGGPGLVYVGHKAYFHQGIAIDVPGSFKLFPASPALPPQGGVLGLSGLMLEPQADGARASIGLKAPGKGKLTWDVCFQGQAPGDSLQVSAGSTRKQAAASSPGALEHLQIEAPAAEKLEVAVGSGRPRLCGAIGETGTGFVLDAAGVNGARYATALAWDDASWRAELSRRSPELVFLEYGTNEAGDDGPPEGYAAHASQLLARIRAVVPDVDCVMTSPTDRIDKPEYEVRVPLIRDVLRKAAAEQGCFFFDTYQTMGGKGSMAAMIDAKPPKASGDKIHLNWRGYADLGVALYDSMMKGY